MNEVTIESDEGSLQFRGELVAQIEKKLCGEEGNEPARSFKLAVFAKENGGFVAQLEFNSDCPDEINTKLLENVDAFKDVENFFYVFDMNEAFIEQSRLQPSEQSHRTQLYKKLTKFYEELMFELLDQARTTSESNGFLDRDSSVKEKRKRPFWQVW